MYRCVGSVISLSVLVLISGCGPSGPGRYLVSGEVSFKKVPIKLGTISFRSEAGHIGMAQIVEGKYELPREVGLPEGKYRVSVSYPDPKIPLPSGDQLPGEPTPNRELLPRKYNSESTLMVEIKPTDNKAVDFKLD